MSIWSQQKPDVVCYINNFSGYVEMESILVASLLATVKPNNRLEMYLVNRLKNCPAVLGSKLEIAGSHPRNCTHINTNNL